jgi:hypothetical protein
MADERIPQPCMGVASRVFGFSWMLSKYSRESYAIVVCDYFLDVFPRFATKQLAKNWENC